MASLTKRDDGRWRARYRDAAGKEHARHFDRKVDADRWLSLQKSALLRGEWVDPSLGKMTFQQYAETWRKSQAHHRPSSRAHVESTLRRWAYPTLGNRAIASIRPSDIRAWVATISQSLAPSTVKVAHGIIASIFLAAVDDRRIASSPCQRAGRSGGTYLPRAEPRRVEPFETEMVRTLTDAVDRRYRALTVLAAGPGMRQGECLGLTVDRIDFLRRTVTVDRQLINIARQVPTFGPPKTRASNRKIPLPQVVVDALAAHLAEFPVTGNGLLFTIDGEPIRRSSFSYAVWTPALKALRAANAEAAAKRKATVGANAVVPRSESQEISFTFHDLRHYYASLLIRHNESVKVVQARLGHATAAETLDTYSHLWPDSDDRTREAVDEVLSPPEQKEAQA